MKRFVSFVLVLTMLTGLLIGCTSKDADTNEANNVKEVEEVDGIEKNTEEEGNVKIAEMEEILMSQL